MAPQKTEKNERAAERRPYSIEQALFVARQLDKIATYNVHQLAGQFANLDFWLDEAVHAIRVIDDYPRRFELLRDAQVDWVNAHDTLVTRYCRICGGGCEFGPERPGPPRRIPSEEMNAARRAVSDAAYRLLLRIFRARWIDEAALRQACEKVGASVDTEDLEEARKVDDEGGPFSS